MGVEVSTAKRVYIIADMVEDEILIFFMVASLCLPRCGGSDASLGANGRSDGCGERSASEGCGRDDSFEHFQLRCTVEKRLMKMKMKNEE